MNDEETSKLVKKNVWLFTLGLIPLITVNQLRVRDVPSNDIVFQSTQQFLLGAAA